MEVLRQYIRKLIKESMSRTEESSSGGWDTLLDMIKSGELSLWRQAFAIIEMGVAREWPTSAQLDLIHEIYDTP